MVLLIQYFRIVWAHKWIVVILFLSIAIAGTVYTLRLPKLYTAETSLIVDLRIDPALGALAPALAAPTYMQTQIEILRSERVASRTVKILGIERSAEAVAQWREATNAKIPLERYFAGVLQRGLSVEPSRGSNLINLTFSGTDPVFSQAAANAFAQAYMDVSVELRVAPARQSATFLDDQTKSSRSALEATQAKLSKFQQSKGIVSDERMDAENAKYGQLLSQLSSAEAERVETQTRQRNTGAETSPDIIGNSAIQSLKSQISSAETKLTEISSIVGKNHPQRIQLEAQIGELRQQLAAETRRVAGSSTVVTRGSSQKVAELQKMVDEQKRTLLALRSDRDQIAVYQRDVDAARSAYDAVGQRLNQVSMEGQNNQANTRLLSPAVEPLEPSKPRIAVGVLGSVLGGLAAGILAAIGFEMLNRRIRMPEDMIVMAGVPVIGVLRPAGSKRPVFRRMLMTGTARPTRPLLAGPGMRT